MEQRLKLNRETKNFLTLRLQSTPNGNQPLILFHVSVSTLVALLSRQQQISENHFKILVEPDTGTAPRFTIWSGNLHYYTNADPKYFSNRLNSSIDRVLNT